MVDIAINDVARRIQYSGNTGLGPFQFTFNILNQADLAVYKNSTALTLTTDYTVIVNANGTGSITLTGTGNGTAVILADVITIVGDMALARVTDFAPGGDFQTAAVNEQFDSMIVMLQQLDEKIARSVKGPVQDTITGFTLPTDRKGKVLAFDATTGAPTNGPTVSAVQNAEANAIAAAASAASAAASFDAFDDIYLGSYATNPTLDNDGNALTTGDQYFNSVANELRIWNGTTWQAASTVGGTVSSLAVTGVASFADGTAALPSITNTGDVDTGVFFPAADTVAVATAGVERLTIGATGNVGIGNTTPSGLLSMYSATLAQLLLAGDATTTATLTRSSTDASATAVNFRKARGTGGSQLAVASNDPIGQSSYVAYDGSAFVTTSQTRGSVETFTGVSDVSGFLNFSTRPTGPSAALTERMRIDSSGNVAIGTSSPIGKLDIVTGTYRAYFDDPGGTSVRLNGVLANNSAYGPLTINGSILAMQIGGTERMRIDSSGNVGIGNSAPVTPLHVTGASMTTGVVYKAQPAQTSKAAAATLTIAELLTGIVQYTGAAATLTLPTGTSIEGGLPATFPTDMSFDVSFINTGAALLTIGANGNTTVGTMTVATVTSARLRFRKTAANTYTVYRIS